MIKTLGLGFVTLALVTGPVASQQHQHEPMATDAQETAMSRCKGMAMMHDMMEMMGGEMREGMTGEMAMMRSMRLTPANVLKHKEALALNADQVSRIEALSTGMTHGMMNRRLDNAAMEDMPMMAEMQKQHKRLQEAFDTTPADLEGIRTAMEGITRSQGQMMVKHLTTSARVRDLLTPPQRKQLMELPSPCLMDRQG